jgi:radical SAM superfamily enzyme YgiQ (UPF0313 family)
MKVLLINPSIYDFAAYSFWSSPLGLLYVGSILRKNGAELRFIDCMRVVEAKRKADGRAPFVKVKVPRPDALKGVSRHYRRYGISREALAGELSRIDKPDLVLITSIMTYWYPGTKEAVETAREIFPESKIVVGGIYPSLCEEEARQRLRKADLIVKHNEIEKFYRFVEDASSTKLAFKPSIYDLDALPYPCYDLCDDIPFVPLLTSFGCIYRCTYCATPYMHPSIARRSHFSVVEEIKHWHGHGVKRFVIYDDNFVHEKDRYAKPLLRGIARLPFHIDIYNPNAVNAALIDEELAGLFCASGFQELRIGLETIDPETQRSTGGKVNTKVFEKALAILRDAGFDMEKVSVYILTGLPFQRWETVKGAIDYLFALGVRPYIAEYTPIPHTEMFEKYWRHARYPITQDALYQNNVLLPFAWEGFTENDLLYLKRYAREKRPPGRPADALTG